MLKLIRQKIGVALITSVFLVLLVSILGIGYLSVVNNQMETVDSNLNSLQALYCADSGVAESIIYLSGVGSWKNVSSNNLPDGYINPNDANSGNYKTEVVTAGDKDIITIKSTGTISAFRRIIQVTLDKKLVVQRITQQNWKEI